MLLLFPVALIAILDVVAIASLDTAVVAVDALLVTGGVAAAAAAAATSAATKKLPKSVTKNSSAIY